MLPIPLSLLFFFFLLPLLLTQYHRRRQKLPTTTLIRTLAIVRTLLTNPSPTLSPLASRALPNQRLVSTFSINNSFTTASPTHHKAFKSRVERLLKRTSTEWTDIGSLSTALLPLPSSGIISPVPLLQRYVLKVILHLFFPLQVTDSDDKGVAALGEQINTLWLRSKAGVPSTAETQQLRATVATLFPDIGENPLDIILPAYETLWRVVLRFFLEVQVRGPRLWRELLAAYLATPSNKTFMALRDGVSVAFMVKETLRLYPPTKRIYRAVSAEEWVAVDVEYLHSDPKVWGADAASFRPQRWAGQVKEADVGWMPFGAGTFVCPAKGEFAPRIIGILVAAVLGIVPEGAEWEAEREEDRVPSEGGLNNERDGYRTLKFRWE